MGKALFKTGDKVKIAGDLYRGVGRVVEIEMDLVRVTTDTGRTFRYNAEDIVAGKVTKATTKKKTAAKKTAKKTAKKKTVKKSARR